MQEAFGLTAAEVEIVRGITLGQPVKEIAEARGRSAETVRTQLRSILAKTETHSQSELVRVVLGLMDVALIPERAVPGRYRARRLLDPAISQPARCADGRRLDLDRIWRSRGAPCLVHASRFRADPLARRGRTGGRRCAASG